MSTTTTATTETLLLAFTGEDGENQIVMTESGPEFRRKNGSGVFQPENPERYGFLLLEQLAAELSPDGERDDLGDAPEAQPEAMLAAGVVPQDGAPVVDAEPRGVMEPEIVEGWRIERAQHLDVVGFIARKIEHENRTLETWTHRGTLDFDAQECWHEEFPLAVISRLFELRAAAIRDARTMREIDEISSRVVADNRRDGESMSTETIDGWEVDREKRVASRGMLYLSGPDAEFPQISFHVLGVDDIPQDLGIPVRVAQILLGEHDPEAIENRAELLRAVALLTGTMLEPCGDCSGLCPGHLSPEAHAQIRAAQSGWTAPGALPWRPEVGEQCYYYTCREWHLCVRLEDCDGDIPQRFEKLDRLGPSTCYCDATYDGIRPLGSIPVPASVRAKTEPVTLTAERDREPTILVEPPSGSAK